MAAVVAPFAADPEGALPAVAVRVFVPVSMATSMKGMVSEVAGGEMAEAEAWLVDIHMAVGPTPSAREVMAEAEPWLVDIHMAVGPTPSFPAEAVAVVALPLADGVSQVVPALLLRWLQWWRH